MFKVYPGTVGRFFLKAQPETGDLLLPEGGLVILISVRARNNVISYFGAQKIIYYSSGGGRGLNSFKIRSFKTYIFT